MNDSKNISEVKPPEPPKLEYKIERRQDSEITAETKEKVANELRDVRSLNTERKEEFKIAQEKVAEKQKELDNLKKDLETKKAELKELRNDLAKKDVDKAEIEKKISEKEAEKKDLEMKVKEKEKELKEAKTEANERERAAERAETMLRAKETKNETERKEESEKRERNALNEAKAKEIAERIADGHAWKEHKLKKDDFPEIKTKAEFAKHIESVLKEPSESKKLDSERTAYWHDASQTFVVVGDRIRDGGGTAFRPTIGKSYFDEL